MTTLTTQVRDYLAADATLMTLLKGGLYAGLEEIAGHTAPEAYDTCGELLPCGLVRSTSDAPDGPTFYAGRLLVSVWLYHRTSDDANELAAARIRTLLHRTPLPGIYETRWAFDTLGFFEEALAARAAVTRYEVIRRL